MEAIGNLTGGLAHDFNNLLGVVIGNLEMLKDAEPGVAAIREFSGDALDAALRGAELTRRLLAFARRQPLRPQPVVLNELIASIMKLLTRMLGEKIEVVLNLADDAPVVVVDPVQLDAALTNLATNARDAMPRGGRLTIKTGRAALDADFVAFHPDVAPGDYALVTVADDGVGMAPDVVGRIFEPFYTTKERDKGTGLGLSMVYGFIKQSGGHITVHSEPGAGTVFRLYLPPSIATDVAAPAVRGEAALSGRGEIVLVVEDNAALRRVLVRQLKGFGFGVIEAGSGSEALTLLETRAVDILFTDIVMPGEIDGLDLAKMARARWPIIRTILTSGFADTRSSEEVAALNIPLLGKPSRREELVRVLREVLGLA
jgi:CheY-like chemotaxis protein/two-component sensor histidine kinase